MSKHGRGHGGGHGSRSGHGGGHGSGYGRSRGHGHTQGYQDDDGYDTRRRSDYDTPAPQPGDRAYQDARDYDERAYRDESGYGGDARGYGRRSGPAMRGPALMLAMLAGLAVWTLVAWVGYVAVDPVMRWIAGSAGLLVDGGKAIAAIAGVGKEVGAVADGINTSGFIGQTLALVQALAKPLIVVVWALGALALIAAPFVLSRIGGLRGMLRRH